MLKEVNKKYIYLGLLVCFIILATVISSSFSRDSANYNLGFETFGKSGWSALFSEMSSFEAFFLIVSKALYQFGFGQIYLFLIYAILSVSIKFYLINEHSKDKWLSLAFFASYFFILHDSTQIRFSLAVAFVYLGLHYLAEGKKLLFSVMVIFSAIMFHIVSVIFIIMLAATTKKSLLWLFCLVFFAVVLYPINLHGVLLELTGDIISYLNVHGTFLNKLNGYLLMQEPVIVLGIFRPLNLLIYLCAIVLYQCRNEFNKYETICYNAFILSIFFYIFLKDIVILQVRFANIFGFSLVFLVPFIHKKLAKYIGSKNSYVILYSFFIVYLIKFTLYNKMLVL